MERLTKLGGTCHDEVCSYRFHDATFAVPAFSKTHKDSYPQPCSEFGLR